MKIGIASWGFRNLSWQEYFSIASDMGIHYVEVDCEPDEVPLHFDPTMDDEIIEEILAKKQQFDVEIVALAAGGDFTVSSKEHLRTSIDQIKSCIRLADEVETGIVRVFAGWLDEESITCDTFRQVADCLIQLGEYAKLYDVIVALENHGGITANAESTRRLLSEVSMPNVGLTYDPANFYASRQDPREAFEMLSEHVVHVHLKDCRRIDNRFEYCNLGAGDIDYVPLLRTLRRRFSGICCIEYEEPESVVDGTKRDIKFLESVLGTHVSFK